MLIQVKNTSCRTEITYICDICDNIFKDKSDWNKHYSDSQEEIKTVKDKLKKYLDFVGKLITVEMKLSNGKVYSYLVTIKGIQHDAVCITENEFYGATFLVDKKIPVCPGVICYDQLLLDQSISKATDGSLFYEFEFYDEDMASELKLPAFYSKTIEEQLQIVEELLEQ